MGDGDTAVTESPRASLLGATVRGNPATLEAAATEVDGRAVLTTQMVQPFLRARRAGRRSSR